MLKRLVFVALIALVGSVTLARAQEGDYQRQRRHMVQVIRRMQSRTPEAVGAFQGKVLDAMSEVPRHLFVPQRVRNRAYANRPLPIGQGQTISQPYIVALMTDLLRVEPGDKVFELGTGSGYQAAVLSRLVDEVHSMEIIPQLAERARTHLERADCDNVSVYQGDAYYGLEEKAPFDAIVVTAAAGHIPPPLVKQLKPGGRMVIPVGSPFLTQQLTLVEKHPDGSIATEHLLPVSFVPLTGGH
jgi:protein-L-isoaspartate(D-aspartate) O-methyltransferase